MFTGSEWFVRRGSTKTRRADPQRHRQHRERGLRCERLEPRAMLSAAAGDLDPSFGNGGLAFADFGGNEFLRDMAIQRVAGEDRIVAVGHAGGDFALARYTPSGALDTSFGQGGKVTTDIGGNTSDYGQCVSIQPDGKIIVAGYTVKSKQNQQFYDFAMVRYNTNGSLDTSFGSSGKVISNFGATDRGGRIALQSDGKILVTLSTVVDGSQQGTGLARYLDNGQLDTSFGGNGWIVTAVKGADPFGIGPLSVAVQPDGTGEKIVVAGQTIGNTKSFGLARYHSNGALDTSFGTSGIVATTFGDADTNPNDSSMATALAVQPDGKIVVVGRATINETVSNNGASTGEPLTALARYDSDGNLDTTFGSGGKVMTFPPQSPTSVALGGDGRIVVGTNDGLLLTYTSDGVLQPGFGPSYFVVHDVTILEGGAGATADAVVTVERLTGIAKVPFLSEYGGPGWVSSVKVLSDGRIVVAGTTDMEPATPGRQPDFALGCYLTTPPQDIAPAASVDFATADPASPAYNATAGEDYESTYGTLDFGPEVSSRTITVHVLGDDVFEGVRDAGGSWTHYPDESLLVNLSNASGSEILRGSAYAHIYEDDPPPPPSLSINDVSVTEGNKGTVNAVFTVVRSGDTSQVVSVQCATAPGTAAAGIDYKTTSGALTFGAGQTSATITVQVVGDRLAEANETFFVNLSEAGGATITDGQGIGTILDDDGRTSSLSASNAAQAAARPVYSPMASRARAVDQAWIDLGRTTRKSKPEGLALHLAVIDFLFPS